MGNISGDQVRDILRRCIYKWDDREEPNDDHRTRFLTGWRDALGRRPTYRASTLDRLTWQNLGFRFGDELGVADSAEIYSVFEILATFWRDSRSLPGDVSDEQRLFEGATLRVSANAYERNPIARERCVEHYGAGCQVCGFDFGSFYGRAAEGFIHVHHLVPLSQIREEYQVDPIADLRPVCANCHAVIHLGGQTRSIEEMKSLFLQRGKNRHGQHSA